MSETPKPKPSPETDAQLVAKAVQGDSQAVTTLLGRCGPAVRQRLAARIGQHWKGSLDEDDVMQVTYLEAFTRINRFVIRKGGEAEAGAAFQSWLTLIAENNLRDAIRGLERAKRPDPRRRVQSPANQDSYVSLVEILGVTSNTPSRQAAKHEAVSAIDNALKQMPEDYRKVIRLYDLECRPIEEVCAELGRTSGAVYMLRARAQDRLKELLGGASQFFTHAP